MRTTLLIVVVVLAASVCNSDAKTEVRNIPSTSDNENYFDIVQALLGDGKLTDQMCENAGRENLLSCISLCNSPGPRLRGNCCCVAEGNEFHIGVQGSCRYQQTLLNFTSGSRMIYESRPVNSDVANGYFDSKSCSPTNSNVAGLPCTCSLTWELTLTGIRDYTPKPTPSVSPSTLPPSATPSLSMSATVTPSPSSSASISQTPGLSPSTSPSASVTASISMPPATQVTPPVGGGDQTPGGGTSSSVEPEASDGPEASTAALSSPSTSGTNGATTSPSSNTEDDDVCVDAAWLKARGIGAKELVHRSARMANVLCPDSSIGEGLPCGTDKHQVRVKDETMSYAELCEMEGVKCERRRMQVNSVWSHVWRETVHGEVTLTMLDVRYAERAQKLLHRVMRSLRGMGVM